MNNPKLRRPRCWSGDWKPLLELDPTKGWLPTVGYCSTEPGEYKWCVQCFGRGHYSRSAEGALEWACGKGFIRDSSTVRGLAEQLENMVKNSGEEAAADAV